MILLKQLLCLFLVSGATQLDTFKKEMAPLQNAVDAAISGTGARVMLSPKATYLDGYGVIVVTEVMLEPPANPFSGLNNGEETRKIVYKRRDDMTAKLSDLVKDKVGKTDSLGTDDSLTLIVHILNSNPVAVSDLPTQLVITMKKSATDVTVRKL
jgi:hypothetical protein